MNDPAGRVPSVLHRVAAGTRAWASDERSKRPLTQQALGRDAFVGLGVPQRYLGMTLSTLVAHDGPADAVSEAEEAFDASQVPPARSWLIA